MENKSKPEAMSKGLKIKLGLCAVPAFFWVIFMWNFWNRGIYALGLNAFIFLLLFIGVFIRTLRKKQGLLKADLTWLVPLLLMALSFALYDNTYLKVFSIMIFPVTFIIFYNFAFLEDRKNRHWDLIFLVRLVVRTLSFLEKIGKSFTRYTELIVPAGKAERKIISKVILGLILFLALALLVFIPLLSAADAAFAGKMQAIYDWLTQILSVPLIYKTVVFAIFSVLIASMLFAWGKKFNYKEKAENRKLADPIVSSIVLGGILALYLLFLWVQIEHLWVGVLPFDFKETESLVKSGFWELLFLSALNILIYFFTYRKTIIPVQRLLAAFTIASLLLLVSAAYRMVLYVVYYGLSYEKFFASYTVLYCAILLVWLISRLFMSRRANILKFLIVLFIWMYSVATVMPVEQLILRANVDLSRLNGSRIKLYELTMLSPDALPLVKQYQNQGLLKDEISGASGENSDQSGTDLGWTSWVKKQEKIVSEKKWYELNLMNIINRHE
jgi:hypothetical protein